MSRLVTVVAAALLDAKDQVLLAERPAGKAMAGLWEFPGGKIGAGESPEQALVRELLEELGLDVEEDALVPLTFASHAYSDSHLLMPLFVCRQWRSTLEPREGQRLKWVIPAAIDVAQMPPADVPLVDALRQFVRPSHPGSSR